MDGHSLRVFTTRPETVFGVSFVAISVEHDICRKLSSQDDELKQKVDAISLAPRSRKQFNTGGCVGWIKECEGLMPEAVCTFLSGW